MLHLTRERCVPIQWGMNTDKSPIRACFHCVHGKHEGASICWHPLLVKARGPARCDEERSMAGVCGPEAKHMVMPHEQRPREDSSSVRKLQTSLPVARHVGRDVSESTCSGDAARTGEQHEPEARCIFGRGGGCVATCRDGLIYKYCGRTWQYRKASHAKLAFEGYGPQAASGK